MCAKRSDIQIPVQIWTQFRAKESEYERRCILIYGQMLNRLPLYLDRAPLYRGPVSVKVEKPNCFSCLANCCTSFLCCCWWKLCRTTRTVSHSLWQFLSRIQTWLYSCLVNHRCRDLVSEKGDYWQQMKWIHVNTNKQMENKTLDTQNCAHS